MGRWALPVPHWALGTFKVQCPMIGHGPHGGAWGMGHGPCRMARAACGIGHWALGIGHGPRDGARGIGHWTLGIGHGPHPGPHHGAHDGALPMSNAALDIGHGARPGGPRGTAGQAGRPASPPAPPGPPPGQSTRPAGCGPQPKLGAGKGRSPGAHRGGALSGPSVSRRGP